MPISRCICIKSEANTLKTKIFSLSSSGNITIFFDKKYKKSILIHDRFISMVENQLFRKERKM